MTIDNEHNDDHGGGPMSERDDAEFALLRCRTPNRRRNSMPPSWPASVRRWPRSASRPPPTTQPCRLMQ